MNAKFLSIAYPNCFPRENGGLKVLLYKDPRFRGESIENFLGQFILDRPHKCNLGTLCDYNPINFSIWQDFDLDPEQEGWEIGYDF